MNFVFQGRAQPRPILVVDDNPSIHKAFARIMRVPDRGGLSQHHADDPSGDSPTDPVFDVTFAICGEQATFVLERRICDRQPFAMAFVDMSMPPGWDGVKTIEQLLRIQPSLEVAVCSGGVDYSWHEVVHRFGPQLRLVHKPFSTGEVLSTAFELSNRWWQRTHGGHFSRPAVARTG